MRNNSCQFLRPKNWVPFFYWHILHSVRSSIVTFVWFYGCQNWIVSCKQYRCVATSKDHGTSRNEAHEGYRLVAAGVYTLSVQYQSRQAVTNAWVKSPKKLNGCATQIEVHDDALNRWRKTSVSNMYVIVTSVNTYTVQIRSLNYFNCDISTNLQIYRCQNVVRQTITRCLRDNTTERLMRAERWYQCVILFTMQKV